MAFSATQWRDELASWSGSSQGDRSWSALGKSTRIGEYFSYFFVQYQPGKDINYIYRGLSYPNQSPTTEKNVEAFYGSGYYTTYVVAGLYNINNGTFSYTANYSFNTNFNWYQGQGNYSGYAFSAPANYITYQGGSPTSYYAATYYAGYTAPTSWSPSTFFNYSPWGSGPYSAGSNIAIGRGPAGSPASGYPYQYIHN